MKQYGKAAIMKLQPKLNQTRAGMVGCRLTSDRATEIKVQAARPGGSVARTDKIRKASAWCETR